MRSQVLVCAAALLAIPLDAQSLLRDLAPGAPSLVEASDPTGFATLGSKTYFSALGPDGRELWRTDGTTAGTELVIDLYPGPQSGLIATAPVLVVGAALMFAGRTPDGYRLFVSDGTAIGTRSVGPKTGFWFTKESFLANGNVLYFVAGDSTTGFELWRSDGTDSGTRMIKDIGKGATSGIRTRNIFELSPVGNGVLFGADDGVHGLEPWYSDGTANGTVMIADVRPGAGDSEPRGFHVLGNFAIFAANSGGSASTWFRTDGTAAGTKQVFNLGIRVFDEDDTVRIGNVVLFAGFTYQNGNELWKTDGTSAGTKFVADLYPGTYWSNPTGFAVRNGVAYFSARTANGSRLFRSDGSTAGTRLAVSATAKNNPSSPGPLTNIRGKLYFSAYASGLGAEPWVSDGTEKGTFPLRDVNPGAPHSSALDFAPVGATGVLFRASDGRHGVEPWITDGTSAGTKLLADINTRAKSSEPARFHRVGKDLFFTDGRGLELWGTDGTAGNTNRVTTFPWTVRTILSAGDTLLFAKDKEILRVTSPAATPQLVYRFANWVPAFGVVGKRIYASSGGAVWRYDDGASAAVHLQTFNRGFYPVPPYDFRAADGVMFFLASEGFGYRSGLWRTDGTATGTVLVKSGTVGFASGSNAFAEMLVAHGKLWFVYPVGVRRQLWVADRKASTKVADLGSGTRAWSMELTAFGQGVAFAGEDAAAGVELWWSDGTAAGTKRATDLNPGAGDSTPQHLTVTADGKALFFSADDGASGRELWRTDGVVTARVRDISPGATSSRPHGITPAGSGNRVVFAAATPDHGTEVWASDGTAQGTARLSDIAPGPSSSMPSGFALAGTQIVFAAHGTPAGREPWVLPLVRTGAWLAETFGVGCKGSAGVPGLGGVGAARVGHAGFRAAVTRARASAATSLLVSAASTRVPLGGGCTLLIDQPVPIAATQSNSAGVATFGLAIPNSSSLVGATVLFQAFVADPAGGFGGAFALTNGLCVMVGR